MDLRDSANLAALLEYLSLIFITHRCLTTLTPVPTHLMSSCDFCGHQAHKTLIHKTEKKSQIIFE